jgi:hypothetical protein
MAISGDYFKGILDYLSNSNEQFYDVISSQSDLISKYSSNIKTEDILKLGLLNPRTKNILKDIFSNDCLRIEYDESTELKKLLIEIKKSQLIQKCHCTNQIELILNELFQKKFEPSPHIFDSVLIQYYNKPILGLVNKTIDINKSENHSILFEITKFRQIVEQKIKDDLILKIRQMELNRYKDLMQIGTNKSYWLNAANLIMTTGIIIIAALVILEK